MPRDLFRRVWHVTALLLVALVVRGVVLMAMYGNLAQDPDAYREIAENVLQHGVYGLGMDGEPRPTAYRPPLYPILLTKIALGNSHVHSLNVALLHLALGLATVWLTYVVFLASGGREPPDNSASRGRSASSQTVAEGRKHQGADAPRLPYGALAAGMLVACDPILLNQSALVMTETLAAFLTILSLYTLVRFDAARTPWNAGLAGAAIGLAILSRPTFLPWLGLIAIIALALKTRWWVRVANCVAMLAIAAGVLAPWTVRNYNDFGKPIATTTHGGYTLLLGNNPEFYQYLRQDRTGLPWQSGTLDFQRKFLIILQRIEAMRVEWPKDIPDFWDDPVPVYVTSEILQDEEDYKTGWKAIRREPVSFLRACLYRVRQLWSPLPHKLTADESRARQALRYATAAWYAAVYLLAVAGVYRLRGKLLRPPWVYGVLLCLVFTAVHTLYWSNLRMRAPLMPFVALVAGAGVSGLLASRHKALPQHELQ